MGRLKWAAIFSFVVSMAVLLGGGYFAVDQMPPYPGKVLGPEGKLLDLSSPPWSLCPCSGWW